MMFSLAVVLLAPTAARAQEARTPEPTPHISPAVGVHYGSPLRASFAGGLLVDMSQHRNDGVIVALEVGQQGNEVSAGYFRMLGRFGSGFSLRLATLRTAGEPWNASPNTTYAGVEASWMIAFGVGARVGYLRRASKTSGLDPHENLASLSVGIGI
ncbi:MAG: hypothetical protein ABI664_20295 [bacterium]